MGDVTIGPWNSLPEQVRSIENSSYENVVFGKFPEIKNQVLQDSDPEEKKERNVFELDPYFSQVPEERKLEYGEALKLVKVYTDGLITTISKIIINLNYGTPVKIIGINNIRSIYHFYGELDLAYGQIAKILPEDIMEEFKDDNLYHLIDYLLGSLHEELEKRGININE